MKQLATIIIVLFSLSAGAQKASKQEPVQPTDTVKQEQPKTLVLQGDVTAYQALLEALEKSEESHRKVEALKAWILDQLNRQIQPKEVPKK